MTAAKTRFAPSPTGLIHIGNARTALFSALAGESFLLRIEDTDGERSRHEFVEELLQDLPQATILAGRMDRTQMEREMEQQYQNARSALPKDIRAPQREEQQPKRSIWSRMTFGLFD